MILDRPLFRQVGGPIMPPEAAMAPGPPPVAPPPVPSGPPPMPPGPPPGAGPEVAVAAAEEEAGLAGEELGLGYLQSVTSALDGAEDYEEAINAIRGNVLPLQERYDELAEYVGEADASATPESVLTMVQPTILLTEEGAIDSGIGALMEETLGGISMEAPQMDEGVGQLMLAGQPEPPVQNFAHGGPVQHFANGDEVRSIEEYMGDYLPLFEKVMGGRSGYDERQRNLDIARAGFAFAGGVDPTTGKSMAGQPVLSQVGRALSPVATSEGERLAAQRKSDQAIHLAALQSGIASREAELKRRADLEAELKKEARQKDDKTITLSPGQVVFDAAGNEIASVPKDDEEGKTVTVPRGSVVINARTGAEIYKADAAPEDEKAAQNYILPDGRTIVLSYDQGQTYLPPGSKFGDPTLPMPARSIYMSGQAGYEVSQDVRIDTETQRQIDDMRVGQADADEYRVDNPDASVADLEEIRKQGIQNSKDVWEAIDKGTGPWSTLRAGFSMLLSPVTSPLGKEYDFFADTRGARNYLKLIERLTKQALVMSRNNAVTEQEMVKQLYPSPDAWLSTPEAEAEKMRQLRDTFLVVKERNLESILGTRDVQARNDYLTANREIDRLLWLIGPEPPEETSISRQNELRSYLVTPP